MLESQTNDIESSPEAINAFLKLESPVLWTAINHHKTHKNKNMTLKNHAFLKEIMMDDSQFMAIMKSTQSGISEWLIIYTIVDAKTGRSVFYVLPTFDLMHRFVSNRFEKSLVYTPYYRSLVQSDFENLKKSSNRSLKDIGDGVVSFAGSNTPVPFTEFPADTLIIDEKDRCNQEHIKMGKERLSHSDYKKIIEVSNPTITNFGIHETYKKSDQKEWVIPCSSCGEWIHPDFFEHVVRQVDDDMYILRDEEWHNRSDRDIFPICHRCNNPYSRFEDGEWVPQVDWAEWSGYQISKMFSGTTEIKELVENFNKGLVNDFELQRFYNADLGLPYVGVGSNITYEMLEACVGDHRMAQSVRFPTVMGVDVGKAMHVRINEILPDDSKKAVFIGSVHELSDLRELFIRYKCICAVIDALPETRIAKQFCNMFNGKVFRCFFGSEKKDMITPKDKIVTVNRTQMLDGVKEEFLLKRIMLPVNVKSIPEYYAHMQASTRLYDEKKEKYVWEEGNNDDHLLLSEGYAFIAFKILNLIRS